MQPPHDTFLAFSLAGALVLVLVVALVVVAALGMVALQGESGGSAPQQRHAHRSRRSACGGLHACCLPPSCAATARPRAAEPLHWLAGGQLLLLECCALSSAPAGHAPYSVCPQPLPREIKGLARRNACRGSY
jgi:hypothetical protein